MSKLRDVFHRCDSCTHLFYAIDWIFEGDMCNAEGSKTDIFGYIFYPEKARKCKYYKRAKK